MDENQTGGIYRAINALQAELAKEGIAKDRRNQQQGFNFRGIDDVYNALSSLLAKHGVCIMPRVVKRDCVERVNAKGTALFYVTVAMEFDFVCSADGSRHTVSMHGEAMDSGDKATIKAQSAAYKAAAFQTFCIPTQGDNDADGTTHEVAAVPEELLLSAREAALQGISTYKAYFSMLTAEQRKALAPEHESLKAAAMAVPE